MKCDKNIEKCKTAVANATRQKDAVLQLVGESKHAEGEEARKRQQQIAELRDEHLKEYKRIEGELAQVSQEREKISEQLSTHLGTSLHFLMSISKDLAPVSNEIVIAMKEELGLAFDERWYKGEMNASLEETFKWLNQYIDDTGYGPEIRNWMAKGAGGATNDRSPSKENTLAAKPAATG